MNGDVESVAPRPRPSSGGLWTILSWLRRDERDSSSESISSAGSDRTAASFAFLKPAYYSLDSATSNAVPIFEPPTDSYKKRIHERNVRRQYERDLTLHRKYGLYRSEGGTGYDTFTLQQYRKIDGDSIGKWSRERRAASECLQRRSVHVPGKRRAPLPPTCPTSTEGSVTLARRTRKRRAPQPPNRTIQRSEENIKLNNIPSEMSSPNCSEPSITTNDTSLDCKLGKYVKKDNSHKETKNRSEKSFLRQIFENRKRISSADTASIKILPNISELDKQAAEIIENGKLKLAKQNNIIFGEEVKNTAPQTWFCTRCLKKYDASVKECSYCFPKFKDETAGSVMNLLPHLKNEIYTQTDCGIVHPSTSKINKIEDKQKLKEILKEMKDSLPKKSKQEKDQTAKTKDNVLQENIGKSPIVSEMPTLRIRPADTKEYPSNEASFSGIENNKNISGNLATHFKPPHIKLEEAVHLNNNETSVKRNTKITELLIKLPKHKVSQDIKSEKVNIDNHGDTSKMVSTTNAKKDLHTPLRISALLNPMYIPRSKDSTKLQTKQSLSTPNTTSDIKTSVTTKPDMISTKVISLNSDTSTTTSPAAVIQPKIVNTNTSKVKPVTNELILQPTRLNTSKDEVKVDKRKIVIQTKPPISSNNMPPLKDGLVKSNPLKSFCKENDPTDSHSSAILPKASNTSILSSNIERVNQHARRRELVNQLEKSIGKGDESAAADAAVKLAQLRLSCSVLSFSSQIVNEPPTSALDITVDKKPTTYEEEEIATKAIKPLHKIENKKKNSEIQMHVVNKVNTILPAHTNISINEVKSVQGVKKETADQHVSMKSGIVNNNIIGQTTVGGEIEIVGENKTINASIQVWVEDKEATRGPIHLNVRRQAVMGELRIQAEAALGLPSRLQRWIVGRTLCTDDNIPVVTLAGPEFNAPFYLCLVEAGQSDGIKPSTSGIQADKKQTTAKTISQSNIKIIEPAVVKAVKQETVNPIGHNNKQAAIQDTVKIMMQNADQAANVYKELVELEQQALVPNTETFECGVCLDECRPDQGVVLRECVHTFCKDCLSNLVRHCQDPDVFCPAMGCPGMLQEREIRALVSPEDYERWLARGLAAAESGTRNAFHCRTRDCTGWALCDPGVRKFPCPVCNNINCIPCQAIHKDETCENYRARLQAVANIDSDQIDVSTKALINSLINKGEALECPECKAVITKKWGCDWVKCSACKTEICWVTRGRRWGPAGRGDTSDGCRCGVDGKKCHPSCGYCH